LGPGAGFTLRLRQFYFPGWRATVDGAPVEVRPDGPAGLIALDVPASEAPRRVEAWYGGTSAQAAAALVSVAALVACIGLGAWALRRNRGAVDADAQERDHAHAGDALPARVALVLGVAILAATALNQLVVIPHTDWFRPHSDPSAPAGMQHP